MAMSLFNYFVYLGTGVVMLMFFMALYEAITPYPELRLIREGNLAAALSFGGATLGFTLTLASSAIGAIKLPEFVFWAAVAGLLQLAAFAIAAYAIRQIREHMINGNVAVGAALMFFSLSVGLINAVALT